MPWMIVLGAGSVLHLMVMFMVALKNVPCVQLSRAGRNSQMQGSDRLHDSSLEVEFCGERKYTEPFEHAQPSRNMLDALSPRYVDVPLLTLPRHCTPAAANCSHCFADIVRSGPQPSDEVTMRCNVTGSFAAHTMHRHAAAAMHSTSRAAHLRLMTWAMFL